jgi:hypothetical protein
MKSRSRKCLQLFLVLIVIAAGFGYACAGSESCSMPCCRHSAEDTPHQGAAGNASGRCETKSPSAGASATSCRLDAKDFAAGPEVKTGVGLSAFIVANFDDAPIVLTTRCAPLPIGGPLAHPIPIFLQVQALLI